LRILDRKMNKILIEFWVKRELERQKKDEVQVTKRLVLLSRAHSLYRGDQRGGGCQN